MSCRKKLEKGGEDIKILSGCRKPNKACSVVNESYIYYQFLRL